MRTGRRSPGATGTETPDGNGLEESIAQLLVLIK